MEADLPVVTAHSQAEMIEAVDKVQAERCAAAFAADCRLALRWRIIRLCLPMSAEYEFILLSPGDPMPTGDGWEIWENHSGIAMGRPL